MTHTGGTATGNSGSAKSGEGHRNRLRERFALAPGAVPDYELLEMLLAYGLPRRDTKPLARALLARFGSLKGVLEAPAQALLAVQGFGPGLNVFWQVLREVRARAAVSEYAQSEQLTDPAAVARMAQSRLAGNRHEECWLALLNNQNRLLDWRLVQRGSVNAVHIEPREIVQPALELGASALILVHNHPGGDPAPSRADVALTETLKQLAPTLGLRFLDHVIVSDGDCYSLFLGTTV